MLTLSRKRDEALVIGDNVRVVVVEISCGRVKLGIEAPKEVAIDRSEVRDAKMASESERDK